MDDVYKSLRRIQTKMAKGVSFEDAVNTTSTRYRTPVRSLLLSSDAAETSVEKSADATCPAGASIPIPQKPVSAEEKIARNALGIQEGDIMEMMLELPEGEEARAEFLGGLEDRTAEGIAQKDIRTIAQMSPQKSEMGADTKLVVEHLINRLWPYDYKRMWKISKKRLVDTFVAADAHLQDYIIQELKGEEL
jgi:hypothetical protein